MRKKCYTKFMKNQKGLAPILIVLLITVLIGGAYYFSKTSPLQPSTNQTKPTNQASSNSTSVVTKITYTRSGDIFVYDLENKNSKKLTDYKYNSNPIISPDGTKVAYLSTPQSVLDSNQLKTNFASVYEYKNVWIINSDGINPIQVTNDSKRRSGLSWSYDNKKIVFIEDGHLYEYSLETKEKKYIDGNGVTSPVYAPKTDNLAYVVHNEKVITLTSGGIDFRFENTTGTPKIRDLNWSLDNKHLFFTAVDESEQQGHTTTLRLKYAIWHYSLKSKKATQITQYDDRIHTPFVSPSNLYIAAIKGTGYADAGNISLALVVLKLDKEQSVEKEISLEDFKGPDFFEKEKQFLFPVGNIIWLNEKEFIVELDELNSPQPNPRGIYKLNVENISAERLYELSI